MGNSPKKNLKKFFNRGFPYDSLSHGKFSEKKFYGNPPIFPYGESSAFLSQKPYGESPPLFFLWEIPTFLPTPLWEIPKKNLEKNFFFGIYGQLFPQKWGCPLGRGGMGGYLPPPMGYMGGAITCSGACSGTYWDYIFSALLILFFLAVSDAMLLFISATFLLWRYLL